MSFNTVESPAAYDRVDSGAAYSASTSSDRLIAESQMTNIPLAKPNTDQALQVLPRVELFDPSSDSDTAPDAPVNAAPNVVEGSQNDKIDKANVPNARELNKKEDKDGVKDGIEDGAKDFGKRLDEAANANRESNVDKEALLQSIHTALKEGRLRGLRIQNFERSNFGGDGSKPKK